MIRHNALLAIEELKADLATTSLTLDEKSAYTQELLDWIAKNRNGVLSPSSIGDAQLALPVDEIEERRCFVSGTKIQMWPTEIALLEHQEVPCGYEQQIINHSWRKPIEDVVPGDLVVAYDGMGRLRPGRVHHPAEDILGRDTLILFSMILVGFEVLSFSIGTAAALAAKRPRLIPYALTMMFYFILGTFAAYKALYELIWNPFFWDKTEHGHDDPAAT
ncbi:MAG: hypothetical protein ACU0BB_10115 [Paracoccaceae bacterium]